MHALVSVYVYVVLVTVFYGVVCIDWLTMYVCVYDYSFPNMNRSDGD